MFVSGDEWQHRDMAKANGGVWVECPNELGQKFNATTEAAWKWGADYAVILGSDDVVSPKLGDIYLERFEKGFTYMGLRGCHMAEPVSRRALYLSGHASKLRIGETVGAGRTVSRKVLDVVEGRPWPDKLSRGADFRMTMRLQGKGIAGVDSVIETGDIGDDAFLVDVKGGGNMWQFDRVAKHTHVASEAHYEKILSALPSEEQAIVRELEQAACPTCGHLRPW